jgi:chromosome segregation ATPase
MDKIAEERRRGDNDAERLRQVEHLAELDTNILEWTTKCVESEELVAQADENLKREEAKSQTDKNRRDELRASIAACKDRLNSLERAKSSSLLSFHQNMPRVVAEIQRFKREFKEMPIGPLGMSVKIKKEQWTSICENIFGRSLNGFLVTNYDDQKRLREILNKEKW